MELLWSVLGVLRVPWELFGYSVRDAGMDTVDSALDARVSAGASKKRTDRYRSAARGRTTRSRARKDGEQQRQNRLSMGFTRQQDRTLALAN